MSYETDNESPWIETACDLQEELDCATSHIESEMSADIKRDINLCNSDLYNGPLYFDAEGEECSCFDEGAKQFDFCGALRRVRDWANDISDIQVEVAYNPDTGESAYERVDNSAREILRRILGKELASML